MLLTPLALGAVGPRGRIALEVGAALVGLIWLAAVWNARRPPLGRALAVGVFGLLGLAVLQLVPLPGRVVSTIAPGAERLRRESLPPADARLAEARLLGVDPSSFDAPPTLSLDPPGTASALRTGAALVTLLLAAHASAAAGGGRILAAGMLVAAAFQGLFGVLALGAGSTHLWNEPRRWVFDASTGTFVNPNHFAAFLAMTLPAGVALLARRRAHPAGVDWRTRVAGYLGGRGSRDLLVGLLVVAGLAGLLTSFSRSGIALGVAAVACTVWLTERRRALGARAAVLAAAVLLAAVPLTMVGVERLAERYADVPDQLAAPGGRLAVWSDTLRIAAAFPATGSGFGTFAAVYPAFRSPEVRLLYHHAHNDALQLLAEGGGLAGALLALLLVPLLGRVRTALGGAHGALGVGFAAGLVAVLVHGLVDFDFHIPANAATAAILAGTLAGLPWRSPR